MRINKALFSEKFFKSYLFFIDILFETYTGMGEDAKLKTVHRDRKECIENWDDSWNKMFTENIELSGLQELIDGYEELMSLFSQELGLNLKTEKPV